MGIDIDLFVHPERISSQLICPICTQVLDRPVQTATEHLFCEDELLEWMTRSSLCPITKTQLDPSAIRRPGRIVTNMLAELEVRCRNHAHGCPWTGPTDQLSAHLASCTHRSSAALEEELAQRDRLIEELQQRLDEEIARNAMLAAENAALREKIEEFQRRIRVFNALLPSYQGNKATQCAKDDDTASVRTLADSLSQLLDDNDDESERHTHSSSHSPSLHSSPSRPEVSDAERLRRLRSLRSLSADDQKHARK